MDDRIRHFRDALLRLDRSEAERLILAAKSQAVTSGWLESLVGPALESIGADWERGELALSQVYTSGRLCEDLVTQVLPPAAPAPYGSRRTALVVLEDYHMLGKRIVHAVLGANGLGVLDYGRMDRDDLVARVQADDIRVLLISTLMLPSALSVKEVKRRLGGGVKVAVGGAPFRLDDQLWREVGADAVGRSASDAVNLVKQLAGVEA